LQLLKKKTLEIYNNETKTNLKSNQAIQVRVI